ncbi:MAG: sigma-70 family RNA polymerase sigma factor [Acidobacteriota bacterium]
MFATTRWTIVLAAGDRHNRDSRQALETLCGTYWTPVYSFVRRRGHSADEAQDLTQGFFTRLLEKQSLAAANRERGKFRSFLLSSVKNYLANEWDRSQAQKRGGGTTAVPIDAESAERLYSPVRAPQESPEKIFERRWAAALVEQVFSRMRQDAQRAGRLKAFERIKAFLTGEAAGVRYQDVAEELDLSEAAVKVRVHRLRRRFGDLLRQEVAQTVQSPDQVEAEIRYLFSAVE